MRRKELLATLYRELQFRILKNDPKVSQGENEFVKRLEKASSIKRKIFTQSLIFLFFGISIGAPVFFLEETEPISAILVTLAIVPFAFSLYQTTVETSYIESLNIFKPLRNLPLEIGSYQLSALLSIDFIPMIAIALPTIGYLIIYYPISGVLALGWFLTGILMGHTIGLILYNIFGYKFEMGGTRFRVVKGFLKILGLILFMSMFFAITYFRDYIIQRADLFLGYSFFYPFSAGAVFDPIENSLVLLAHFLILMPLYYYHSKKIWDNVIGDVEISSGKGSRDYTLSIESPVVSLLKKDLKIVFRKTAIIAGFLLPLYVLLPQIFISLQDGYISIYQTTFFLFMIGILTTTSADAILKVDGSSIDYLRNLPLSKKRFILSKVFSMCVIPVFLSLSVIVLGAYFDLKSLVLLPYAFLLPLLSSLFTMLYLYRGEGDMIGVPEINFIKLLPIFILLALVMLVVGLPVLFLTGYFAYLVSFIICAVILLFMWQKSIRA